MESQFEITVSNASKQFFNAYLSQIIAYIKAHPTDSDIQIIEGIRKNFLTQTPSSQAVTPFAAPLHGPAVPSLNPLASAAPPPGTGSSKPKKNKPNPDERMNVDEFKNAYLNSKICAYIGSRKPNDTTVCGRPATCTVEGGNPNDPLDNRCESCKKNKGTIRQKLNVQGAVQGIPPQTAPGINIPVGLGGSLSNVPGMPNFSGAPAPMLTASTLPFNNVPVSSSQIPNIPSIGSSVPTLPQSVSSIPAIPSVPSIPAVPAIPSFSAVVPQSVPTFSAVAPQAAPSFNAAPAIPSFNSVAPQALPQAVPTFSAVAVPEIPSFNSVASLNTTREAELPVNTTIPAINQNESPIMVNQNQITKVEEPEDEPLSWKSIEGLTQFVFPSFEEHRSLLCANGNGQNICYGKLPFVPVNQSQFLDANWFQSLLPITKDSSDGQFLHENNIIYFYKGTEQAVQF